MDGWMKEGTGGIHGDDPELIENLQDKSLSGWVTFQLDNELVRVTSNPLF